MTPARNLSRRSLFVVGGAAAGIALVGCAAGASDTAPTTDVPSGPIEIAKLSDIPVGGSIAATLDGKPIVLTQTSAGTVVAFTAICTHQGCVVEPATDEFACPCHGSRFDSATGEVIEGPASRALDTVSVTVVGDAVVSA